MLLSTWLIWELCFLESPLYCSRLELAQRGLCMRLGGSKAWSSSQISRKYKVWSGSQITIRHGNAQGQRWPAPLSLSSFYSESGLLPPMLSMCPDSPRDAWLHSPRWHHYSFLRSLLLWSTLDVPDFSNFPAGSSFSTTTLGFKYMCYWPFLWLFTFIFQNITSQTHFIFV